MNICPTTSIQVRLTLLLGLIALVVSTVAGCTLFLALKREVQRQEMTEVAGKLELIDHMVDMQTDPSQLDGLRQTLDGILVGHANLRVWIVRPDGEVFYGAEEPHITQIYPDGEVLLQTPDGLRMRGMRLTLDGNSFRGVNSSSLSTYVRAHSFFMPLRQL